MILELGKKEVPQELLECLNEVGRLGGWDRLSSYLAFTVDSAYVKDDSGRPILFIGAYQPSYLAYYKEVWLLASEHLRPHHLPELRRLMRDWIASQSHKIVARCIDDKALRFANLMGFRPTVTENGVTILEAV